MFQDTNTTTLQKLTDLTIQAHTQRIKVHRFRNCVFHIQIPGHTNQDTELDMVEVL